MKRKLWKRKKGNFVLPNEHVQYVLLKATRNLFMRQIYKLCTRSRTRKLCSDLTRKYFRHSFRCQKRIKSRRVERKSHSKLIQLFKQRPDDIFWSNIKATKRAYRRTLWIKSKYVPKHESVCGAFEKVDIDCK